MPRRPDPENQHPKYNFGTLKIGLEEGGRFKAALKYYGWDSISSFMKAAALALIRQRARGEPIIQPLSFQAQPGPAARKKYGHLLQTVAADQVDRENQTDG